MPKIVFISRYLRDAPPEQLENYVRYVSTREGVEKVEGSRDSLPSTAQQKDLIRQIVRDFPSAKEMLESVQSQGNCSFRAGRWREPLTIWCGQGLLQRSSAGGRMAGGAACFLR